MATQTLQTKPQTFTYLFWRRFRRHRLAMASLVVILLLILMALFAPWIAPTTLWPSPGGRTSLSASSPP